MKKSLFYFTLLSALFILAGCNPPNNEKFVQRYALQGEMYLGHAPEIRLTHTIPIEQRYDATEVGVSGAHVELTAGTQMHILQEIANDPRGSGYYALAAGDTHTVTPNMDYAILIDIGGDTIRARTRAAGFFEFTSKNLDTTMFGVQNGELILHWSKDSLASGYWLLMENINPHRDDDSTRLEGNVNGGGEKGVFAAYWNIPSRTDSVEVPWLLFTNSGEHRLRVFTCDRALWDYSSTFQPGQAELPDPVTNVQGAYGVFCAGDVDTTYLYMRINPDIKNR